MSGPARSIRTVMKAPSPIRKHLRSKTIKRNGWCWALTEFCCSSSCLFRKVLLRTGFRQKIFMNIQSILNDAKKHIALIGVGLAVVLVMEYLGLFVGMRNF